MSATAKIERDIYNAQVEVTVDDVKCVECGQDLSFDLVTNRSDELIVTAEPCPKCIKSAVDEAKHQAVDTNADGKAPDGAA